MAHQGSRDHGHSVSRAMQQPPLQQVLPFVQLPSQKLKSQMTPAERSLYKMKKASRRSNMFVSASTTTSSSRSSWSFISAAASSLFNGVSVFSSSPSPPQPLAHPPSLQSANAASSEATTGRPSDGGEASARGPSHSLRMPLLQSSQRTNSSNGAGGTFEQQQQQQQHGGSRFAPPQAASAVVAADFTSSDAAQLKRSGGRVQVLRPCRSLREAGRRLRSATTNTWFHQRKRRLPPNPAYQTGTTGRPART